MHLVQYRRFLMTGAVVGVIAVGCRELLGRALGSDTATYYSISVVSAYCIGIVLSFLINRTFTFRRRGSRDWSRLPVFAVIAGVGLVSTWILSLGFRYGLDLDMLLGGASPPAAFALAALCSSVITYPLTALLVFPNPGSASEHERDFASVPLE